MPGFVVLCMPHMLTIHHTLAVANTLELRSAIENKKRVLLVRDIKYKLPDPLPESVADLKDVLLNTKTIEYMAEFHQQCVDKIKEELGPKDDVLDVFSEPINIKYLQYAKEPSSVE